MRTYELQREYNLKLICSHGEFSLGGDDSKHSNLYEFLLKNHNQRFIIPYYTNKKDGTIKHDFFGISTNRFVLEDI